MRYLLAALLFTGAAHAQTMQATSAVPFSLLVASISNPDGDDATTVAVEVSNGGTAVALATFECTISTGDGDRATEQGEATNLKPNEVRISTIVFPSKISAKAVNCRVTGFSER